MLLLLLTIFRRSDGGGGGGSSLGPCQAKRADDPTLCSNLPVQYFLKNILTLIFRAVVFFLPVGVAAPKAERQRRRRKKKRGTESHLDLYIRQSQDTKKGYAIKRGAEKIFSQRLFFVCVRERENGCSARKIMKAGWSGGGYLFLCLARGGPPLYYSNYSHTPSPEGMLAEKTVGNK